jgi:hypothetical protein
MLRLRDAGLRLGEEFGQLKGTKFRLTSHGHGQDLPGPPAAGSIPAFG